MKPILLLAALLFGGLASLPAQTSDYAKLKAEAEKLYSEKSYSRAHELYLKVDAAALSPEDARWVKFRVADTMWRAQAATRTADNTRYEEAQRQLEALVRDVRREEERDRVWAEVHESLGDFWWTRREDRNWGQAWPHYQPALDWWAGARDLELARQRYLAMVGRMARPPEAEPHYCYGYYGNVVPSDVLENALRIAPEPNAQSHAHYLLAVTLSRQGYDGDLRRRVVEEFEAALKLGKKTDWFDDALYQYANWMMNNGRVILTEDGQCLNAPDFPKALELFRRLIREYQKGETQYYDQAKNQIDAITRPSLSVSVANIFLPDSETQFYLNWRNLKRVDFTLFKLDLTRQVRFSKKEQGSHNWIQEVNLADCESVKAWARDTGDKGDYRPGNENVRIGGKLARGAYILEAKSGGQSVRDLVLITDAAIVLKTSGKQALVYFCDTFNGSPLAGADVKVWEKSYGGQSWNWREMAGKTNAEGLAVFDLRDSASNVELHVSAALKDRQAFTLGNSYWNRRETENWRIYAFTDRPAYRPKEEVKWKFVARRDNGSVYSTPSDQTIEYQVNDPRGAKVQEGKAKLNAFGSAWGSLALTEAMPLGAYNVTFWDEGRHNHIGSAALFRLEEYKLPEFKVSVQTPEEDGRKKTFRLGRPVEVSIQADYYFGGAVANAAVEVVVYQNPFCQYWRPPRNFPWFYEDMSPYGGRWRQYGGQGPIIKRETLKTDATGKATIRFDTPRGSPQEFEYRIEARVTDSSRREIIGSGTVRVTRQRYYVHAWPDHCLYRPQDQVKVDFKTLDANGQSVPVDGTVKVTREAYSEVWLDASGREVKGAELKAAYDKGGGFPPPSTRPGERPWRLKFRGYQHDDILTRRVKTDAQGEAELTFTPEREGYYRVAWLSRDQDGLPIRAETTVWVATNASTDLGYRHGGLEIIVDQDTFRAGQKAAVMLNVPTNDRYVLFSVEGEDLYSYQLVHLTGTTKLLEIPLTEKHVPNIFLAAAMVSDQQFYQDIKPVIVPPVEHFLTVDVKPDRAQYQPQEEGTLKVTTRDADGRPVRAEVALGLVDESLYYIQPDLAGDPRQFYYGNKRTQCIQTGTTFQQKSYVRLVEGPEEQLFDERNLPREEETRRDVDRLRAARVGAFLGGGVAGGKDDSFKTIMNGPAATAPMSESVAQNRVSAFDGKLAEKKEKESAGREAGMEGMGGGEEPAVQVRSDFRSTVFWRPDVVTDQNGEAVIGVKYPDSLTSWKAMARVVTAANQFGIAEAATRTRQPLIVRLQAPRFFVVGDQVTISAVINNHTDQELSVKAQLEAAGLPKPEKAGSDTVKVAANREARVDWTVAPQQAGEVKLKVAARGGKYADAMEKNYLVHQHGIEKFISTAGKVRGRDVTVRLNLPKERKPESTVLSVQIAPSLAVAMLDALPYLADYPYGCTEQTMSRFLPAAITAKTLRDLKLDPEDAMNRVFGGIEQQYVGKTQPKGRKDLKKLDEMVKAGLDRLYDFQHGDGGWGWWKLGESDHYMTAYVVWGLTLARDAGLVIKGDVLDRGLNYLDKELVEEENRPDQQAWMLHALAVDHASAKRGAVGKFQARAFDNLWENREKLNAYTRALLALCAHRFGYADKARILIENLENGVKRDDRPDTSVVQEGPQESNAAAMATAHWGEDGIYYRWSEGGIEATCFALRALLAIDPQSQLVEPVANWLIRNRRGAQWSNTRDTALAVLALNDYLRKSGELKADGEYELLVNGRSIAQHRFTLEDVLRAPSRFRVEAKDIKDGTNEIRIRSKKGDGPIYFAAQAAFFSLEEPVTPAGNEMFVRRQYYKLSGRPTLLKGYVYDRNPLNDGETVTSGDRVETVITVETKNHYEYLVFEDLKPAGLEAVAIQSGDNVFARELKSGAVGRKFKGGEAPAASAAKAAPDAASALGRKGGKDGLIERRVTGVEPGETDYTGRQRWVYQELRDRKVAFFVDQLPEGVWEIRYDLRAETPGKFHALPVMGHAMYVPEIRCNGSEVRITVADRKP